MSRLSPYIFCEDARKQADFYAKALGGEIVSVQTFENWPDASPEERSRVMHLVLKVGELQIFMADSSPIRSGNQIDLALELQSEAEARTVFERLSRDGRVIFPLKLMPWGSMLGRVEDPFGVRWQIAVK